jgi:outer membrane immunogenic protein
VTGGGQVGCDYQFGLAVFGVEGTGEWADSNGSHFVSAANATLASHARWYAMATGRIGLALDRSLIYVNGGGAWIDVKESIVVSGTGVDDGGSTHQGWTVGAGWEFSFMPNWSAKLEYNYLDFTSTAACSPIVCGAASAVNDKETIHSVLLGVNYRF